MGKERKTKGEGRRGEEREGEGKIEMGVALELQVKPRVQRLMLKVGVATGMLLKRCGKPY